MMEELENNKLKGGISLLVLDRSENAEQFATKEDDSNIQLMKLTDSDFQHKVQFLINNDQKGIFESVCLISHSPSITKESLKERLKDYGKDIKLLVEKCSKKPNSFVDKVCLKALEEILKEYDGFLKLHSVEFALYQLGEEVSTKEDYIFFYVPEKNKTERPKGNSL